MFRKSRKDKVADQASHTSAQAKEIFDKVVPAVGHAAESTRDWAAPSGRRRPRVGRTAGAEGSGRRRPASVESAVDAVSPKIDAARDKLVDEVLPRLVDAINAATTQAAAAKDHALDVGSDVLQVIKGDAVVKPKKKHRVRKVLMLGGLVAAGAAAFKAFRGGPKDDPWAAPAASTSSWAPATTPAASPTAAAEAAAAEDAARRGRCVGGDRRRLRRRDHRPGLRRGPGRRSRRRPARQDHAERGRQEGQGPRRRLTRAVVLSASGPS